ncbi:hypothetical protein BGW80DRAFT_1435486 [Lactifluus volemus]|nr:hypothetical protein BGW80DRAFT_1435486 [Lactifluus volemus]
MLPVVDNQKLSLQTFLQVLTSKNLQISRAMTVASKIYKDFNTPARLGELTDSKLRSLGISDKDDRRLVLSALNAAGYRAIAVNDARQRESKKRRRNSDVAASPSPPKSGESSTVINYPPSTTLLSPSSLKKRKRHAASSRVENELLPGPALDEGAALGSLDFHEILDEDALKLKSAVVNRAPIMMAWACVVAERLGFSREEALSIASVYTEMNAISKGVSLGIYDKKREADLKAAHANEAQPYVDLLGRRVPLYRTASGSWRAFTTEDSSGNNTPGGGGAPPGAAYSYITRALRQTAPAVLGAMRLLAESYSDPVELNRMGFALYADFRPDVDGWGKRGELRCETLLGLRRKGSKNESQLGSRSSEATATENVISVPEGDTACKKPKLESDDPLDVLFDEFTVEELSSLP